MIVKFTTRARFNGRWYEAGDEAFVTDQADLDSLNAAGYISPQDGSQAKAEPVDDGADAQAPPESDE